MHPVFKDIRKILVIKLKHIGDVLLTVPACRALRETFPDARITALVTSGTEEMLTGNPLINEIRSYDRSITRMGFIQRYLSETRFLSTMRSGGYDMAVALSGGDRAAIISLASGARYRLSYSFQGLSSWKNLIYTHRSEKGSEPHAVLRNSDLLKAFGITTENMSVDLHIPDEDFQSVRNRFAEKGILKGDTVVHVHPTSRLMFKCWDDGKMAEVLVWMASQGIKTVITCSPDTTERDRVSHILSLASARMPRQTADNIISLSGNITLKQLAAVSSLSNLFLGVDSAPMHIAAAVGTPVIALFGAGASSWRPWGPGHTVICKKTGPRGNADRIGFIIKNLEQISTDDVKQALTEKLLLRH